MTDYHARIAAAAVAGDVTALTALAIELVAKAEAADRLALAEKERKEDQAARQRARRSRTVTERHVTSRDVTVQSGTAGDAPASPLVPPPPLPGPNPSTPLNPPSTPSRAARTAGEKPVRPPRQAPARPDWLDPLAAVWEAKFGAGSFPWGKAGKAWKPLHLAGHGSDVIADRLKRYLDRTEAKFVSPHRFAETFDQYAPLKLKGPPVVDLWLSDEVQALLNGHTWHAA